ncbi:MAG: hypothetical protein ABI648_15955 [Betaproteobacteria bacterium]|jgi:hypothetical protein
MKNLWYIWILWPSFLAAAIGNALFFTVFDPRDLVVFGEPVHASRLAIYSVGFLSLWLLTIASNLLTYFLQKSATELNLRSRDPERRHGDEGRPG